MALAANVWVYSVGHAQQSSLTSPEAISDLRQRAATGELAAIHDLGTRLQDDGDPSNDAEGRDLLIRAGNLGYPNSASYLAKAYLYGWYEWSRTDGKANLDEGLRWLRLAGENARPDTLAQDDYRMLGDLYSGFRIRDIDSSGFPVDLTEAIKWYRLCAVEFETFCEGRLGEVLIQSPETALRASNGFRLRLPRATYGACSGWRTCTSPEMWSGKI
ncbi:MAG: sel1 repeat family protein [Rhodospirillaceae bacterium]|nr:sel1 repeat family protein [Rhodospirillaceae bacterium]